MKCDACLNQDTGDCGLGCYCRWPEAKEGPIIVYQLCEECTLSLQALKGELMDYRLANKIFFD